MDNLLLRLGLPFLSASQPYQRTEVIAAVAKAARYTEVTLNKVMRRTDNRDFCIESFVTTGPGPQIVIASGPRKDSPGRMSSLPLPEVAMAVNHLLVDMIASTAREIADRHGAPAAIAAEMWRRSVFAVLAPYASDKRPVLRIGKNDYRIMHLDDTSYDRGLESICGHVVGLTSRGAKVTFQTFCGITLDLRARGAFLDEHRQKLFYAVMSDCECVVSYQIAAHDPLGSTGEITSFHCTVDDSEGHRNMELPFDPIAVSPRKVRRR